MSEIAFIGIGSNLGDRLKNCRQAIDQFSLLPKTRVVQESPFYETEPVVLPHQKGRQEWFINSVIQIKTDLEPEALLKRLQTIEKNMGRESKSDWAPRTIDLDLLFFDTLILATPNLTLPHPEIVKRRFVLQPLFDIAPDWEHPLLKKPIRTLLKELEDRSQVKVWLVNNHS